MCVHHCRFLKRRGINTANYEQNYAHRELGEDHAHEAGEASHRDRQGADWMLNAVCTSGHIETHILTTSLPFELRK